MLDLAAPCNDPTLGPQPQPQPQPCRRRTGLAPAACAVTCLILGATAYLVATPSPRHSTAWAQAPAAVQQPTAAQPPSLRQRPPALHRASPAASQRQAPAVLRSVVWRRGDSAALPHGEGPPIPGHVPRIWAAVCAVLAAGYLCVRRLRHRRQWAVLANTGRETPLTPFARPRAAPMYASIVESPAPKRRRPRDGGTPDSAPDAAGAAPGVAAVVPAAMPEVLAPAGGWDALKAAVSAGADAVYFGSDAFNARARAENFSQAELPEVMAYLHERNVRGYMTFNVLVFPTELAAAADLLRAAEAAGVDAVIVQDVGLACLARHVAPNLRLHGSTQMSITRYGRGNAARGSARAFCGGASDKGIPHSLRTAEGQRGRGQGRKSLEGGGGGLPPPNCPDSTPKAFPYPNTSPNRISNRQKPPHNRFHIPRDRSAPALGLPRWPPSPSSKTLGQGAAAVLYSHMTPELDVPGSNPG